LFIRKYIALIFIALSFSCSKNTIKSQKPLFLVGNWQRVNDKPNEKTFEVWKNNLTGIGYTLSKNKKIFEEDLRIITIKDTLYLEVTGVNQTATLFQFTSQTDSSFVCENPKNEFPKKIKYWLEKDTLRALVSSKDFSIDFNFVLIQ
jgi:hypothetical protein